MYQEVKRFIQLLKEAEVTDEPSFLIRKKLFQGLKETFGAEVASRVVWESEISVSRDVYQALGEEIFDELVDAMVQKCAQINQAVIREGMPPLPIEMLAKNIEIKFS